jgi:hypothetical protein
MSFVWLIYIVTKGILPIKIQEPIFFLKTNDQLILPHSAGTCSKFPVYFGVVLSYETKSKRNERNETKYYETQRNILKNETKRNILKCETQ